MSLKVCYSLAFRYDKLTLFHTCIQIHTFMRILSGYFAIDWHDQCITYKQSLHYMVLCIGPPPPHLSGFNTACFFDCLSRSVYRAHFNLLEMQAQVPLALYRRLPQWDYYTQLLLVSSFKSLIFNHNYGIVSWCYVWYVFIARSRLSPFPIMAVVDIFRKKCYLLWHIYKCYVWLL